MEFILLGFSQTAELRRFAFERIADDRSRSVVAVTADLHLVRDLGIKVQALPLMCRWLLGVSSEMADSCGITLTETQLRNANEQFTPPKRSITRQTRSRKVAAASTESEHFVTARAFR